MVGPTRLIPQKKLDNMTVENPPFEDVFFPIEHGDFPASHVGLPGCNILQFLLSSFSGGGVL